MQNFSQNKEQEYILDYFKNEIGNLLDIGANDGETLSNSRALILNGWSADLVEPSPVAYNKLHNLYKDNEKIEIIKEAICDVSGEMTFWVSGEHLGNGDSDLLSTLSMDDKKKWEATTEFKEITVPTLSWADFMSTRKGEKYDFITIDAEGYDYKILQQMDLTELGCKCICVEHNSVNTQSYIDLLKNKNMKVIHINAENIIAVI